MSPGEPWPPAGMLLLLLCLLLARFAMPTKLAWERCEMTHKRCELRHMSDAAAVRNEMQRSVRDIAALSEGSRKAALAFAAKVLRLPYDRVRRLYYGQARRIEAHEADQIRAYVTAAQKLIQARADYEAQRRDYLAHAHPALVRLAARELGADEVSQAAQEAAGQGVK